MVKDLTRGSPTKLIVSFALTMLMGSMMSYIYSFTDSLMVGWFVSSDALGAVSASSAPMLMLNNLSSTVIGAFSITAGHIFGSGDHKLLRRMMANATYLTVFLVGTITIVSLILCQPLLQLMNTPDELMDMSVTYLTIIILAKPFAAPIWLLSGTFRALGDTKTPLYIGLVNGFGNVVFNFIFLYVFPMGIAGAALGTLCSTATGSLIYLIIFKCKMKMLHFGWEEAPPSFAMMKRLLGIGLPIGLESAVTSLGSMILQAAINVHGTAAITGIAMGSKIMNLFWIFFSVFESALMCFCAQNLGAGQFTRVQRGVRNTLLIFLGIGGVVLLFVLTTLDRFVYMAFVGNDVAILDFAHQYLITQIAFFPCISMLFAWRAGLKSLGSTVPTLFCGIVELVARLFVSFFFADNIQMLFFAGPMAWVGSSIFVAILYPIVVRKMERKMAEHDEKQQDFPKADAVGASNDAQKIAAKQ
ncbi:MAG: polysaccharide biosynthesis C-terminal domain-containing protein [Clostridia bacterium]|nr:polysaccharide biosynthesis C-terminal domain-containing protein [Clostridia bacterium]